MDGQDSLKGGQNQARYGEAIIPRYSGTRDATLRGGWVAPDAQNVARVETGLSAIVYFAQKSVSCCLEIIFRKRR